MTAETRSVTSILEGLAGCFGLPTYSPSDQQELADTIQAKLRELRSLYEMLHSCSCGLTSAAKQQMDADLRSKPWLSIGWSEDTGAIKFKASSMEHRVFLYDELKYVTLSIYNYSLATNRLRSFQLTPERAAKPMSDIRSKFKTCSSWTHPHYSHSGSICMGRDRFSSSDIQVSDVRQLPGVVHRISGWLQDVTINDVYHYEVAPAASSFSRSRIQGVERFREELNSLWRRNDDGRSGAVDTLRNGRWPGDGFYQALSGCAFNEDTRKIVNCVADAPFAAYLLLYGAHLLSGDDYPYKDGIAHFVMNDWAVLASGETGDAANWCGSEVTKLG